jgi:hypothetical protein
MFRRDTFLPILTSVAFTAAMIGMVVAYHDLPGRVLRQAQLSRKVAGIPSPAASKARATSQALQEPRREPVTWQETRLLAHDLSRTDAFTAPSVAGVLPGT